LRSLRCDGLKIGHGIRTCHGPPSRDVEGLDRMTDQGRF
jgi:hypothetical protein